MSTKICNGNLISFPIHIVDLFVCLFICLLVARFNLRFSTFSLCCVSVCRVKVLFCFDINVCKITCFLWLICKCHTYVHSSKFDFIWILFYFGLKLWNWNIKYPLCFHLQWRKTSKFLFFELRIFIILNSEFSIVFLPMSAVICMEKRYYSIDVSYWSILLRLLWQAIEYYSCWNPNANFIPEIPFESLCMLFC